MYLERRLDSPVRLSDFILELLNFCKEQNIYITQETTQQEVEFNQTGKQIEEAVQNARNFTTSQLHQTMGL